MKHQKNTIPFAVKAHAAKWNLCICS